MNSLFLKRIANVGLAAVGLAVAATSMQAASLVTNGSFEQLSSPGVAAEFGSRYPSQQVTGWTTSGYNFVFTPGSADTKGAKGEFGGVALWGPGRGSNNGLPATSPDGGNFLALDAAYAVGPVTQSISGLTPGEATTVSFYWAGAQQAGFTGATTEQLKVSLGSSTQSTPVLNNVSHGFTGWKATAFSFVPTSSTEVLSFLAVGTPGGVPPFSLLDGVSVSTTPEPASLGLMACTLVGFGAFAYRRRKQSRSEKS